MRNSHYDRSKAKALLLCVISIAAGAVIALFGNLALAKMTPPTEHQGLTVASLGVLPEASLERQLKLSGFIMQIREITIAPGGAIANHSHANRPGLVLVTSGSVVEGRPQSEKTYFAGDGVAIVEDADTEHWFRNTGSEPAVLIVTDLVPAK